ncbi:hypothetical protein GCM10023185_05290 [Hymenobacter saemangeumensis]|uniref:Uncharacterized protein n=1 Tax=Hymenobacter saemangeumensis TaxID=1084522 RepID=A0ABP8I0M5_9BACT
MKQAPPVAGGAWVFASVGVKVAARKEFVQQDRTGLLPVDVGALVQGGQAHGFGYAAGAGFRSPGSQHPGQYHRPAGAEATPLPETSCHFGSGSGRRPAG